MSILATLSAPARKRTGGPQQFQPLGDHVQTFDAETDTTYALVTRISDDEPHVLYVKGSHADICSSHNERARLTHARNALDETDTDGRETLEKRIAAIAKTRASRTAPVARALMLFDAEEDDAEE